MASNFSIKEVCYICEYGHFDVMDGFYCPFRNKKKLDALSSVKSIQKHSYYPKSYSASGALCFKVRIRRN